MARYRAVLAYDGSAYNGYQIQAGDTPTIQAELERALESVCGQQTTVWAAGRTDAGVHATGQVIAFDVDWQHDDLTLLRALNATLPGDIALQSIAQHPGFHPRFDALSRTYHYTIAECQVRQPLLLKRAWQMHTKLDFDAMQQAAGMLTGEHDFAVFGRPPQGENTIREVFASRWRVQPASFGRLGVYEVEATAFLQHMVRRMVGMMARVGMGQMSLAEYEEAFRSGDISRVKRLAPPQGLVLESVRYPPGVAHTTTTRHNDHVTGGREAVGGRESK